MEVEEESKMEPREKRMKRKMRNPNIKSPTKILKREEKGPGF